jgi:hypothetical protein
MAAEPDLAAVDALCRLQLAARRLGCRVTVHGASPELRRLLRFVGLDHLAVGDGGEPEQRGEVGVEEGVEATDAPPVHLDHLQSEVESGAGRGTPVQPEGR